MHRIVHNHLLAEFKDRYLYEITPGRIENYLLDLYENGKQLEDGSRISLSSRTINTIRPCMKAIFGEAIRLQYIKFNLVNATHKFREDPKQRGILTRNELWELLFKPDALHSSWNGETRFSCSR